MAWAERIASGVGKGDCCVRLSRKAKRLLDSGRKSELSSRHISA